MREAFPGPLSEYSKDGMSLLEWYAGMALVGLLAGWPQGNAANSVELSEASFKFAEEMMKSAEVRRT
jgi:uncharacterized protein YodC (DUF2158 family)